MKLSIASMRLVGGNVVLDFVNTFDSRTSENPEELLRSYDDFLVFSKRSGLIDRTRAKKLQDAASKDATRAEVMLSRVHKVRELIYRLASAHLPHCTLKPDDLRRFNRLLNRIEKRRIVVSTKLGYDFGWNVADDSLDLPLLVIIHAASQLLVSKKMLKLRECGGPGCGWLFLDTSPNHLRRWCSMESCGNRYKAQMFYKRRISRPQ